MTVAIVQPVGVNVDVVSSSPGHGLGDVARGKDGSRWVYVKANSAITQYMCVTMDKTFGANPSTKTHVDLGRKIGFAQVAFTASQYGWVATEGGNNGLYVRARNSCAVGVALYTTAVAGYLDDTSASQTLVNGVVLTDTATSSGAAEECRVFTQAFPTPSP